VSEASTLTLKGRSAVVLQLRPRPIRRQAHQPPGIPSGVRPSTATGARSRSPCSQLPLPHCIVRILHAQRWQRIALTLRRRPDTACSALSRAHPIDQPSHTMWCIVTNSNMLFSL